MNSPESIVVSLEWARKLKDAGWPQDVCHFKYCGGHTWFHDDQDNGKFEPCDYDGILESDEYCPRAELTCEFTLAAPTAEEILHKIPKTVKCDDIWYARGKIFCDWNDGRSHDTLANTAAAMYCHLAKHNFFRPAE